MRKDFLIYDLKFAISSYKRMVSSHVLIYVDYKYISGVFDIDFNVFLNTVFLTGRIFAV
jgi:hypothetical protein